MSSKNRLAELLQDGPVTISQGEFKDALDKEVVYDDKQDMTDKQLDAAVGKLLDKVSFVRLQESVEFVQQRRRGEIITDALNRALAERAEAIEEVTK